MIAYMPALSLNIFSHDFALSLKSKIKCVLKTSEEK